MYQIYLNDILTPYQDGTRVVDLIKKEELHKYVICEINGNVHQLTHTLSSKHNNMKIKLCGLDTSEGGKAYEGTLRYVISMAFYNLFNDVKIKFSYNVSRAIYCEILNKDFKVNHHYEEIMNEINKIISLDLPIEEIKLPAPEVINIYKKYNHLDKIDVLKTRIDKNVNIYKCGNYYNYTYSNMLPSTGFLTDFIIRPYSPGLIIQYPRCELGGIIPQFKEEQQYSKTLAKAHEWGRITGNDTITGINKKINKKDLTSFIQTCEAKHNNMLAELGLKIKEEIDSIRLICIAGPSSSGKTTFCNRLKIELMSRGINPIMISLDNYYLTKEEIAKIQGTDIDHIDLESVNCLDIDLFNKNLVSLLNGDKVTLPIYNFKTGKKEKGPTVRITDGSPVMIEGIHALNEKISSSIPKHQKYRIFIAPQIQINIDNHSPISTTDLRIIRRIVRDKQFRNTPLIETIKMWPSVRKAEFKWIYPAQENADYVFNSELTYELCVFKKYVYDELKEIPTDAPEYATARKLIRYLYFFESVTDESSIPCNSIIREFIGGSCFEV